VFRKVDDMRVDPEWLHNNDADGHAPQAPWLGKSVKAYRSATV
jgi:hypothetical protein